MSRLSRRLPEDERGAVAVLVAAMVGGGVLLGMLALVIDVGRLLEERRELQNGADAAAAALARSCALLRAECSAVTAPTTAHTIAAANAKDGLADIRSVCGSAVGLAPCQLPGNSPYDCGPLPGTGTPFVEVRARTRSATGGSVRSMFLRSETTVGSCARAAWGVPTRNTGISFTMSLCEWRTATSNGTLYASYPPNPPTSYERRILLHHTFDGVTTCPAGPSGADLPGGFGWLEDTSSTCQTTTNADGTYADLTGNSTRGPCKDAIAEARADRTVVFVPVYDAVTGAGSEGSYHLAGFGAFVVTGYSLSGVRERSWLTGTFPCSGSERCVSGFFVKAFMPAEGPLGPPTADFGALVVRPVP
jgi:Putative Flp pilus-assembly TadE/G-like